MVLDAYCQGWPIKLKDDATVTVSCLFHLWRLQLMKLDTT